MYAITFKNGSMGMVTQLYSCFQAAWTAMRELERDGCEPILAPLIGECPPRWTCRNTLKFSCHKGD